MKIILQLINRFKFIILSISIILVAVFTLVFIAFQISNSSLPTTFNITLETESIEFVTNKKMDSRWSFNNVKIIENYKDTINYTGSITIGPLVNVTLERISNGPLYIKLIKEEGGIGDYIGYNDQFIGEIPKRLEIYVDSISSRCRKGEAIILPIIGVDSKINSSRPVGFETYTSVPILKSGKVSLLNRSIVGDNIYQAGEINLNLGDQFVVETLKSPNYGFISINENPALTFVNRLSGKGAKVIRPGGSSYPVRSSLLNKFLYDDFFRGTSLIFTGLLVLITILSFCLELINYSKDDKK